MPKGIPGSGKAKTIKAKSAKIKAPRSMRAEGVRKSHMSTNKDDGNYQCVLVGDIWHLLQEQANPPSANSLGAWTTCSIWANFKRGYNRQLPDCPECLKHAEEYENKVKTSNKKAKSS